MFGKIESENLDATFFEVVTVMAMMHFSRKKVDYVVLETGMGGRLDATNIIEKPVCTAITSLGMDHMAVLGNTIDLIAAEKAGIIKHGVPCVAGPTAFCN